MTICTDSHYYSRFLLYQNPPATYAHLFCQLSLAGELEVYRHNGKMVLKEAREMWAEQNPQAGGSNVGEETKRMADLASGIKQESPK